MAFHKKLNTYALYYEKKNGHLLIKLSFGDITNSKVISSYRAGNQ